MKDRNKLKALAVVLMAAVLAFTLPDKMITSANAASSSTIKDQIAELEAQKAQIEKQLEEIHAQFEEKQDEIANIIARKNVIDQEVNLLSSQIANMNEQISAYNMLIADQQDALDIAQAQYDGLKGKYMLRIRAMEEEGSITYWQILFKANSFSDLLDRLNMVQEIAIADKQRLQELSDAAVSVESAKEVLQVEKAELEATRLELEETQTELEIKRVEANVMLQEFLRETGGLEELQAELEAMEAEFLKQIASKEAEYDEAKKKEWEAYHATSNPAPESFGWLAPCSYVYLSSPFGYRDAPVAGASTYHQGVDLAAYRGTPVYATRAGIVTIADHGWSAGNYVQIDHQDGFKSIYMHLETYCVSAGQIVNAGEQIGTVGTSGVSSGYHLHFGISYQGVYVNPCSYVDLHT